MGTQQSCCGHSCQGARGALALWTQADWQSALTVLQRSEHRPVWGRGTVLRMHGDPRPEELALGRCLKLFLCSSAQWSEVGKGPQPRTPSPGGGERFGMKPALSCGDSGLAEAGVQRGPWVQAHGHSHCCGRGHGTWVDVMGCQSRRNLGGGFGRLEAVSAVAEWHRGSGDGKGRAGQVSLPTDPSGKGSSTCGIGRQALGPARQQGALAMRDPGVLVGRCGDRTGLFVRAGLDERPPGVLTDPDPVS